MKDSVPSRMQLKKFTFDNKNAPGLPQVLLLASERHLPDTVSL